MNDKGKLYICGTPIGNLDDMTFRALEILKKVETIAAEDTRRTAGLLNHFDIDTSLTSYHEHNEQQKSEKLIKKLIEGKNIALVSDAGMPGISDPGSILINKAIDNNIDVIPIPGPTAVISALVVSGFSMDRFTFEGFIPRKGKEREEFINRIREEKRTVIFYESPYRLKETLKELATLKEKREVTIVREISKIHEEKIYGTLEDVIQKLEDREIKGEIVVVLDGREVIEAEKEGWEHLSIKEHVELLMENGYTKKKAIKKVAKLRNLQKRKVYKEAIPIQRSEQSDD